MYINLFLRKGIFTIILHKDIHEVNDTKKIIPREIRICVSYALNPSSSELQELEGILTQACADALAICSIVIQELHMLATARICFIPYWDNDPQRVSNVLT